MSALSPRRLVLATRNLHKVQEVRRILGPLGLEIAALPREVVLPPEDGETFAENALGKARAAAAATGTPAIADDSGIEAEALDGAPGIRSARYAGEQATDEENLARLIAEVPAGSGLRYVCAMAYVDADQEWVVHGTCDGLMAAARRGERGFGYDPVFEPLQTEDDRTMAELAEAEKDAISHRGRALRALAAALDVAERP